MRRLPGRGRADRGGRSHPVLSLAWAVRLKVCSTLAGFDDAYVAAANQAAALTARGARGDLFALGEAQVVTDPDLTAAPLANPGHVIRSPRGDMAAMLASEPHPAQQAESHIRKPSNAVKSPRSPPTAPPPDRSARDAAEAALNAAREQLAADLEAVDAQRAELDARERKLRKADEGQVRKLERARTAAQRAYVKAGGEPSWAPPS